MSEFHKKHSVILSTELLWAARTYFVIMLTPIAHHDKSKAKERILKLKQNKKKRNHRCLHIVPTWIFLTMVNERI